MMTDFSFGQYVRNLRIIKGMTQAELCDQVEINFTYLSKIERDRSISPSEEVLIKIAEVLGENSYRMLIKAGKVPMDFQHLILTDDETYNFLEQKVLQKKAK